MIDKEINNIIKILNSNGLKTRYSCAGHKDKPKLNKGYILFKSRLDDNDIKTGKTILHKKGIERVSAKNTLRQGKTATIFNFTAQS